MKGGRGGIVFRFLGKQNARIVHLLDRYSTFYVGGHTFSNFILIAEFKLEHEQPRERDLDRPQHPSLETSLGDKHLMQRLSKRRDGRLQFILGPTPLISQVST